jgi:hypothetical protein
LEEGAHFRVALSLAAIKKKKMWRIAARQIVAIARMRPDQSLIRCSPPKARQGKLFACKACLHLDSGAYAMTETANLITTFVTAPDAAVKLLRPAQAFYQTMQNESEAVYQTARDHLLALHGELVQTALQLYREPLGTLESWQSRAIGYSSEMLTEFDRELLPQLDAAYRRALIELDGGYRQLLAELGDAGAETRSFLHALYTQPQETSAQVYAHITAGLHHAGAETAQLYRQAAAETVSGIETNLAAMQQLYNTGLAVAAELLDASTAGAAALYYQLSAALLEFYAQSVGVMLALLHNAAMPSGWAL